MPILSAQHLVKTFRGSESGAAGVAAVAGVDLDVDAGEFVAITGASGSGKSTLLKGIMGLVDVRSGQISLDGLRIDALRPDLRHRRGVAFITDCP